MHLSINMNKNNKNNKKNIVFISGFTAGHINPLLSICETLDKEKLNFNLIIIKSNTDIEKLILNSNKKSSQGYRKELVFNVNLKKKINKFHLLFFIRLINSIRQAKKVLFKNKAHLIVGFGGCLSLPFYIAAFFLRIPVILHEANIKPGLANKFGAYIAKIALVAFKNTPIYKAKYIGMPIRKRISKKTCVDIRAKVLKKFKFNPHLPILTVMGGSLGSIRINKIIKLIIENLQKYRIQILHITGIGKSLLNDNNRLIRKTGYYQIEFLQSIEEAYAVSDLILSRSGSSTIHEIMHLGIPAVFIPLPIGNGEQNFNIINLVKNGAAIKINDDKLNKDEFENKILPLLKNKHLLSKMSEKIRELRTIDTNKKFISIIRKIIN